MNCVAHIVKYILYVFNLLSLLFGILLIIFGSITLSKLGDFIDFADTKTTQILPICVVALGCVISFVSFLGCCGAIKDNRCLVVSYSICMLTLLILQFALVVYTWVARSKFLDEMGKVVDHAWELHNQEKGYMDALQMSFDCCGRNGYLDYGSEPIPNSCCGSLTAQCDIAQVTYKQGCRTAFVHFWATNTDLIKYVGLGIAAVEGIALVFAWFLASSIKVSRLGK